MDSKQILQFTPSDHFIQQMNKRKIDVEKIIDVIKNSIPKFITRKKVELVKDKIRIIADMINHKLVTVMYVYERFAYLDKLVNDLEDLVLSSIEKEEQIRTDKLSL